MSSFQQSVSRDHKSRALTSPTSLSAMFQAASSIFASISTLVAPRSAVPKSTILAHSAARIPAARARPATGSLTLNLDVRAIPVPASSISYPQLHSGIGRIITPYNPEAFAALLSHFNLANRFPGLVHSLKFGFKIGIHGSTLADSIIPPYRPSNDDIHIDEYLTEEITAGRMDGPYSEREMRKMCGGHFAACPVHVVTQADEVGKLKRRIVRNMSYKGQAGYSVNDLLDSDDFPTEWGSASVVANIVSVVIICMVIVVRCVASTA